MKTLSESLIDLALRVKKLEDSAGVARLEMARVESGQVAGKS